MPLTELTRDREEAGSPAVKEYTAGKSEVWSAQVTVSWSALGSCDV